MSWLCRWGNGNRHVRLAAAATRRGVEVRTGARWSGCRRRSPAVVRLADGTTVTADDVFAQRRAGGAGGLLGSPLDGRRPRGHHVKANLAVSRRRSVRSGELVPSDSRGQVHVNEEYDQLEQAYRRGARGRTGRSCRRGQLPLVARSVDPVAGVEAAGAQTLTVFVLTPAGAAAPGRPAGHYVQSARRCSRRWTRCWRSRSGTVWWRRSALR